MELHNGTAGGYGDGNKQHPGFFPFNNDCYTVNDTTSSNNLYFGMRVDIPFYMTSNGKTLNKDTNKEENIYFSFTGDDDVWVFVDDKLVMDLGGASYELSKGILNVGANNALVLQETYEDGTTEYLVTHDKVFGENGLSEGNHTLKIFYMERFRRRF